MTALRPKPAKIHVLNLLLHDLGAAGMPRMHFIDKIGQSEGISTGSSSRKK